MIIIWLLILSFFSISDLVLFFIITYRVTQHHHGGWTKGTALQYKERMFED